MTTDCRDRRAGCKTVEKVSTPGMVGEYFQRVLEGNERKGGGMNGTDRIRIPVTSGTVGMSHGISSKFTLPVLVSRVPAERRFGKLMPRLRGFCFTGASPPELPAF
jgi:hypothetical protein